MTEATKLVTEPPNADWWPYIRARCELRKPLAYKCQYPWCKCAAAAELELPPDTRTEGTPDERIERAT